MRSLADTAVEDARRDEWGGVVATLIRLTGDWELAVDRARDAFAEASVRWPLDGVPESRGAWLAQHALALDRRSGAAAVDTGDDRLALAFACCDPALAPESRAVLTLHALAGLTTAEIARALLVDEATAARWLADARRELRDAAVPFRVPGPEELAERTAGLCDLLCALFDAGGACTVADPARGDLRTEAIRLARVLPTLLPAAAEVEGLASWLLLRHSRRAACLDAHGHPVPLAAQDRSRWHRVTIEEGLERLRTAQWLGRHGAPGPYALRAAIAAEHARAEWPEDTDWQAIAALHVELAHHTRPARLVGGPAGGNG